MTPKILSNHELLKFRWHSAFNAMVVSNNLGQRLPLAVAQGYVEAYFDEIERVLGFTP